MVALHILINLFWTIIGNLGILFNVNPIIANLSYQVSNITSWTAYMSGVVANVYYFIPRSIVLPLIFLVLGFVVLRIVLAIVNLIWW